MCGVRGVCGGFFDVSEIDDFDGCWGVRFPDSGVLVSGCVEPRGGVREGVKFARGVGFVIFCL